MNKLMLTVAAMTLCAMAAQAKDKDFAKDHPRRAEVLRRDNRSQKRFDKQEKNGKITAGQEQKLDKEENAIKAQEQAEAKANGGHITKAEQRQLNREENKVNRQDRRMQRRDARAKKQAGANGGQSAGTPATPATPATPPSGGQ